MICMNINIECYDILMERRKKNQRKREKPFNPNHHKISGWFGKVNIK